MTHFNVYLTHSRLQITRVVQQLQSRPFYLYLYLDALFKKDPHLVSVYADSQVKLYAEYAPGRLIDFLRASNYYNLEEVSAAIPRALYLSDSQCDTPTGI